MNLTAFRTEVSAKTSLSTSDAAELALIDQWVNDGVSYVTAEGQTKVATATAALTANVGDYTLDTGVLRLLWVQNSTRQLEPANPTEVLLRRLNTASSSSTPLIYAVNGANMLMVYPTPTAADTLTIYYVPRPVTLSSGSDTPTEIPAEFHRLVTLYALWQAGDYDDDQSSAQGVRYKQDLDEGIRDMRSRVNLKRGQRLPRASVSRGARSRVPSRNDIG